MGKKDKKKARDSDDEDDVPERTQAAERGHFTIDRDALDDEWTRQAELVLDYNEQLANSRLRVEELDNELTVIAAELHRDITDDPDSFGVGKNTVDAIKAAVPRQPRYQKALKRFNQGKHMVAMLNAACLALEHKKRALTMLVELQGRDYYAEPREKSPGKAAKKKPTGVSREDLEGDD